MSGPHRPVPSYMDAEDARRHLRFKALAEPVRSRMEAALAEATGQVDWAGLLHDATFPPFTGTELFHTAPVEARAAITADGLRAGSGRNWSSEQFRLQEPGVYVTPEPDVHGRWAHAAAWDVWEVSATGLTVVPDALNPGCYRVVGDVPAVAVRLHSSHDLNGD